MYSKKLHIAAMKRGISNARQLKIALDKKGVKGYSGDELSQHIVTGIWNSDPAAKIGNITTVCKFLGLTSIKILGFHNV